MNEDVKAYITYGLLTISILCFVGDFIVFNPPAGRWCEVRMPDYVKNSGTVVLKGNCSYIKEFYETHKPFGMVINISMNLPSTTTTTTTETTTTTDTIPCTITSVSVNIITTTTYKLKHQGNFSSNIKPTTTTSSTIQELVKYWMQACEKNEDCVIVYGCCPNDHPQPLNVNYTKYYNAYLKCPVRTQCGMMVKPGYRAYCSDRKCVKEMIT